jgi:hypothetical protein
MSLTFGLQTPRHLLEKLKRDAALLDEEVTSDRFFNFVVTGYSVLDWVKNCIPSLATEADDMRKNHWVGICGDLANASKHFKLERKQISPASSAVSKPGGWGMGRWGKGGWGIGEEVITITLSDGTALDGLDLVTNVLAAWDRFFSTHGM